MKTVALIMAGGKGERLWPASTNEKPKQFLCLGNDDETMIQKTVSRISPLVDIKDVYILTNELYKDIVVEQLPGIDPKNIVLEPVSKNTAPAIELGLEKVKEKYNEAVVMVLPSDSLIQKVDEFRRIVALGLDYASKNDAIVTVGFKPTEPNTGYGYIQLEKSNNEIHKVISFKEKPCKEVAEQYLKEGNYVWNGGMFIFSIKTMDTAFKTYMPKQYEILSKDVSRFAEVEAISIDYGVMEHANNIYCIPGELGWDDVGSWMALERVFGKDKDGNTILNKNVRMVNTTNTTIKGTNKKVIATLGVENLVIVETDEAIMIANKDAIGDIKKLK